MSVWLEELKDGETLTGYLFHGGGYGHGVGMSQTGASALAGQGKGYLFDLLGTEKTQRLLERQNIEIAPLAYMRGRTLNSSFVILDEAQNTTPEQMKMFLTRIGFGSRAVITGDSSQIDLPRGQRSGLMDAANILRDVRGISITYFTAADVVRHPLVARIVEAYDRAQKNGEKRD